MKTIKIYVTGPFNAGKTTLIHRLALNATSIEHYYKDGTSTTVGFDLGTVYWDSELNVVLKSTPKEPAQFERVYKVILVGTPGQNEICFHARDFSEGVSRCSFSH